MKKTNKSNGRTRNASAARKKTRHFNEPVAQQQANADNLDPARDKPDPVCENQDRRLEENMGLLVAMVKTAEATAEPSDDGMSNGAVEFLEGLRGYDPTRGVRLSTYLFPRVVNKVRAEKMADNIFGSSTPTRHQLIIARAQQGLMDEMEPPTAEAIHRWIKQNIPNPKKHLSLDTINSALQAAGCVSINTPIGVDDDGEAYTLDEVIPDPRSRTPEEILIEREKMATENRLKAWIYEILPGELAIPFILYYEYGNDWAKISEELGIPAAEARSKVREAQKVLRKNISNRPTV